jgi:hypothetical protein
MGGKDLPHVTLSHSRQESTAISVFCAIQAAMCGSSVNGANTLWINDDDEHEDDDDNDDDVVVHRKDAGRSELASSLAQG